MSAFLLVMGIALFVCLVIVHEFGHFIMARRNGVEVEEFAIFFPPKLWSRRTKAGWVFSINLLPLGGFVKLKGEHDTDTEPGSFGAASLRVKSKIMIAGVTMNLITALLLFTLVGWLGMPNIVPNQYSVKSDSKTTTEQVKSIESGSPAAKTGLKPQDNIVAIGLPGQLKAVSSPEALSHITPDLAGKRVEIKYSRGAQQHITYATLLSKSAVNASLNTNSPKGYLGIETNLVPLTHYSWSSPVVAAGVSAQLTALTFQGLGHSLGGLGSLIAGAATGNHIAREHGQTAATQNVAGPIGVFFVLKGSSQIGYQYVLFVVAYISLVLAVVNFLPIPALDGGRFWITLFTRAIKRPLSARTEELLNATFMVILLSLVIAISVVDVKRFH
jgi:regulator of sigma E protease